MIPLRAYLAVAALVGLVFSHAGMYIKGRQHGEDGEKARNQKVIEELRKSAEDSYARYLKASQEKRVEYRTITKRIEAAKNATPDNPDCRTSDDWLQLYKQNAAIANKRGPAAAVPGGSGSPGWAGLGGSSDVRAQAPTSGR